MQSDELIWSVINNQFCSYKVKTVSQNFCRNQYNVTGFCNRQSCPLANSRYATVREHEGVLYLYMKTVERAHTPKHMWERVRLSNNYAKALEQIDSNLLYWQPFMLHKCKQRITKITQYLIKLRKLRLRENGKMIPKTHKLEKREARREAKALTAARLEKTLEKELVARLKSRAYGDAPLNVNESVWQAVLNGDKAKAASELEEEDELEMEDDDSALEDEEEEEEEGEFEREFVEDFEESDEEDLESLDERFLDGPSDEDDEPQKGKRQAGSGQAGPAKKQKPSKRVEVEYEMEGPVQQKGFAW